MCLLPDDITGFLVDQDFDHFQYKLCVHVHMYYNQRMANTCHCLLKDLKVLLGMYAITTIITS